MRRLNGVEIWFGQGLKPVFTAGRMTPHIERIRVLLRAQGIELGPVLMTSEDASVGKNAYEIWVGNTKRKETRQGGEAVLLHHGGRRVYRNTLQPGPRAQELLAQNLEQVLARAAASEGGGRAEPGSTFAIEA